MTRKKNRRKLRNFIVNKKQLAIIVIGTVYFFLALIAVLTLITAPVYNDIFQSSDISVQRESAKIFILLSEKLTIALSAAFIFTIIPLIWLTHRLFGPLINFTNIFKRVSEGDLTAQVYLRRGDLLKSEAGYVNEMIQSLLQKVSDIKDQNQQLVRTLNGMADDGCPRNGPDKDLREARSQALACEKLLTKFSTDESLE